MNTAPVSTTAVDDPSARIGELRTSIDACDAEIIELVQRRLAISREIVRAHGGEIRVERRASGGTIFMFTLPAARGAAATVAKAPAEAPRASRDPVAGG